MDKSLSLAVGAAAAATGIAATLFATQQKITAGDWTRSLDEALPAIVVIKMNYVRPFDGELVSCSVI